MSSGYAVTLVVLLAILALAAYIDRVYSEMGKFLAREYQDNIDAWEEVVERVVAVVAAVRAVGPTARRAGRGHFWMCSGSLSVLGDHVGV